MPNNIIMADRKSVLPTLTNPATAGDIVQGKEAINGSGAKITGTMEEWFFSQKYDTPYKRNYTINPTSVDGTFLNIFQGMPQLESVTIHSDATLSLVSSSLFLSDCAECESIHFDFPISINTRVYIVSNNTAESVTLGGINRPVSALSSNLAFSRSSSSITSVTLYVDANTIDDIPSSVKDFAPWGAPNATIIYRNSTTGEVITA